MSGVVLRPGLLLGALVWAATAGGAVPTPLGAQENPDAVCAGMSAELRAVCVETALALGAARGAVGLAAAGGADLTATNSTVGKRVGALPRWGITLRAGATRAPLPGVGSGGGFVDGTTTLYSLRGDLAFGLLDGFSIAPTVGGILSLDLLGEASLVALSEDDGFEEGVGGYGIGARLGILRESFGIPGITVTATRRWLGDVSFSRSSGTGSRGADFETTVTSLRGVVGKDLFAIGFLAGVGWDRYEGDASLTVGGPGPAALVEADDLDADRLLFFGSVSWNFLVLQLSAEGGWAEGLGPEAPTVAFDPSDGSLFGALAFRLLL